MVKGFLKSKSTLMLHVLFLHVEYDQAPSVAAQFRRREYAGNGLLVALVAAVLIALAYGGTRYPWSSWQVVVPLVLGIAGLGLFMLYEGSRWCAEPVAPPRLFRNRTTVAAFFPTFTHSLYSFWILYFLPVYVRPCGSRGPSVPASCS